MRKFIEQSNFGKNCRADYVIFDDLVSTDQEHQIAKFRAGHAGWQYGGKIVLLDRSGRPYSVIVSRISRIIELKNGDVEIALPKYDDEHAILIKNFVLALSTLLCRFQSH